MDYEKIIFDYINEELLDREDGSDIDTETSLFQGRILDSLSLVALISFLESTFKVKINTLEVSLENFDSISKMISFLKQKGAH